MRVASGLSCLFLVGVPLAVAQQPGDTVKLKPIVITADRLPRDPKLVTSSVAVLGAATLATQSIRQVTDALRDVAGMTMVESGSFGSQTSAFLRGGESDYTKVLVNGVPLNEPGGAFNFAGLSTDNVDRIEVVRGPGSVLYGTDAMTGVVQIVTRDRPADGEGNLTGAVGFTGGTFATSDWTASLAAGGPATGISMAASRSRTDGTYQYNNESDNRVLDARAHLSGEEGDASLSVHWIDQTYHFPTNGAGMLVDRNQYNRDRGPAFALDAGHRFSDRLEGRFLLTERHEEALFDNEPDGPADTSGFYLIRNDAQIVRRSADVRFNVSFAPAMVATVGGMLEHQTYDATSVCKSQVGDCSIPELQATRDTRAAYLQDVAEWGNLSVSLGGRFDDNTRFGQIFTYRIGAVYRVAEATRIRIQGGTGFKEPTFVENFDYEPSSFGTIRGNPDLQGERTQSWEAGIEQETAGGNVSLGLTGFDQRFRDLVDFTFSPADTSGPNYFNVAAATSRGLEASLRVRRLGAPGLGATVGYTFLHTEVTEPGLDSSAGAAFARGQPLLRRPTHSGSAVLDYRIGTRGGVALSWLVVGKRWDQDFAVFPFPRVELPAYGRVDLAAHWAVTEGHGSAPALVVSGRVRNALNASYEEVLHFPAPGRLLLLGLEVRLGR